MEKIVEQGLLYDFYGELLTEHQRQVYEAAVYDDMSLTEIADEHGISKQGVHDLIKRCTKTLQGYEDKLHMIRRFEAIKESAKELKSVSDSNKDMSDEELRKRLGSISDRILEELNN
ncbi:YlxM family DNA-binding protein [Butyrivibrio sp.]|uniref:YlxM family DNA-binding protein n=1 Tax=Butyrivibrio sp. TaxID=28121 RepID=UPI0025BBC5CC|nr:YlxM family DNA-binding protein [Butyrivibrio sp.]MBE5836740.1 DNA-binding protein [Butyrivibrio sp.]